MADTSTGLGRTLGVLGGMLVGIGALAAWVVPVERGAAPPAPPTLETALETTAAETTPAAEAAAAATPATAEPTPAPAPDDQAAAEPEGATADTAETETAETETAQTETAAAPDGAEAAPADASAATAETEAAVTGTAPGFDVVRVAPDGQAVIAGTAEPGSTVTIYADDAPVAEAEADAAGEFVAVFRAAPSADPQALTLGSEGVDGTQETSNDVVVLLPSAEAEDAATPEADAADAEGAAEPEPQVAATAILRDGRAEVVPTDPEAAAPTGELTLASISYGETGAVRLAGQGAAGSELRAYVDDRFALGGAVEDDGRWSLDLTDVAAGLYTLRIDALDAGGAVTNRIETPFQRDFPAPAKPGEAGGRTTVTVQPGNNLWTLARLHYGAGVQYTKIYVANRTLIRDPELIYPGQIFVLPEGAEADAAGPIPRPDAARRAGAD